MKIELSERIDIQPKKLAGQSSIKITVNSNTVAEWSLKFSLLAEGLVSSIVILDVQGRPRMEILKYEHHKPDNRAEIDLRETGIRLIVSSRELHYWLIFFLRYYRDGVAEVDHIDVEATTTTGESAYLTFSFENSSPPVSSDEAERRLGLMVKNHSATELQILNSRSFS